MIFDSNNTVNYDRLTTKVTVNEDLLFYPDNISRSIEKFDESFYNESKEFLYKEAFGKTRDNFIFMNECIDELLVSFKKLFDDMTNNLNKAFDKLSKSITLKFAKEKDYIDKYSDEFFASNVPIKVKMYNYTITKDTPNYKFLNFNGPNDIFGIDLQKVDPVKLKKFKKDDKEYDIIRAEILGYKNKRIKVDEFKDECWAVYRNGTDKQTIIDIDPEKKHEIMTVIMNCKADLMLLEDEKNIIIDFISMNMKKIINEFSFVSKHSDHLSNFEYDAYTTFIYNKINEMRMLIKYYQLAYAYKMDAIQSRRNDYLLIFKEVIMRTEKSEDVLTLSENPERYLLHSESMDDILYEMKMDDISSSLLEGFLNEDVYLYNESIYDTLSKVVEKMQDTFKTITTKFVNKTVRSFNSAFPKKEEFLELDLTGFSHPVFYYNENYMKNVMTTVRKYANMENNDTEIQEYAKDPMEWLSKNFASALGKSYDKKSEWIDFVKAQLRGNEITNNQQAITRAFTYCEDNNYNSLKDNLAKVNELSSYLSKLDNEIKTAKARDKSSIQNNSANILAEGDEGMNEMKSKQAEADARSMTDAENKNSQGNTDESSFSGSGGTGATSLLQNKRRFFSDLQKLQNCVWSIFEEGRSQFIIYLNTIKRYESKRNKKANVKEAINKTVQSVKRTVVQNNSADLFDTMIDTDYLKNKIISETGISIENFNEELFYDTLDKICENTDLKEKMTRDLSLYLEDSDKMSKSINGYTNLFSIRLNKYINNRTFISY